ncbi:MAG: YeiH family protein [Gemmatimonadales bacterium]
MSPVRRAAGLVGLAAGGTAALAGVISAPVALAGGVALALTAGNPYRTATESLAPRLLRVAVIGLGFGLPLGVVVATARSSLLPTIATIALALMAGRWLGRRFGVDRRLALLLSAGTAICGGSAIAAVAPVIDAEGDDTVVALAVVFLLNGVGLLLFPFLGHLLGLGEAEFGLWAALAIHDTSAVVGAGAAYGGAALAVATTAKLARALWIVPLVLALAWRTGRGRNWRDFPIFILLFLGASLIRTLVPEAAELGTRLTGAARAALAAALFLIGAGMTPKLLRRLSARPLGMAVVLWLLLAGASLALVRW